MTSLRKLGAVCTLPYGKMMGITILKHTVPRYPRVFNTEPSLRLFVAAIFVFSAGGWAKTRLCSSLSCCMRMIHHTSIPGIYSGTTTADQI